MSLDQISLNVIKTQRSSQAVITRLSAGFRRFQKRWFCTSANLYDDLREGQDPLAMVIACSDSRVDPALLTDTHPGDLFVVRNVANLVPAYEPDQKSHGVSAALEYAVRHLQVPEIIVMGHSQCGGIHALLEDAQTAKDEFLNIWMQLIEEAREKSLHHESLEMRRRECELWGIRISLRNLLTFPWVRNAVEQGTLTLHGWYFDMDSGALLELDCEKDEFLPLVTDCESESMSESNSQGNF